MQMMTLCCTDAPSRAQAYPVIQQLSTAQAWEQLEGTGGSENARAGEERLNVHLYIVEQGRLSP